MSKDLSKPGTFTSKNSLTSNSTVEQKIERFNSNNSYVPPEAKSEDSLHTDTDLYENDIKTTGRKQSLRSENANKSKDEEFLKLKTKSSITIGRLSSFLETGSNEEFTANII